MNRIDEMSGLIERMRQIDEESVWFRFMAAWHQLGAGNSVAALDQFERLGGSGGAWGLALVSYDLGRDAESDAAIEFLNESGGNVVQIATAYAYRGDFDAAFEWLEIAYEEHDDELIEIRMYSAFDTMHSDPRWESLLRKIGISDVNAKSAGF
jgi:hypothetical protein